MTKQKVIIGRIEDYSKVDEFIQEVFDQFKVKFEEEVIVKPNFLKFDDPSKGSITHSEVVRAVVGVLKDMGSKIDLFSDRGWCHWRGIFRAMVASDNVVAADIVASSLTGFDEVEHIKLAAKEFGVDSVEVNQDIEKLKIHYSISFLSRGFGLLGT